MSDHVKNIDFVGDIFNAITELKEAIEDTIQGWEDYEDDDADTVGKYVSSADYAKVNQVLESVRSTLLSFASKKSGIPPAALKWTAWSKGNDW